ncbi:MAG: GFA family protein, partial [Halioglobus sp.]|nr:GFA family protein [Halioglobus sp.]
AATLAPEAGFSWVDGQDGIREYRTSSGFLRRFCSGCGGILPQHLSDYGQYWIPAGLLDDDAGLVLSRHIHVASRAGWEVLDEVTRQHPEGFDS